LAVKTSRLPAAMKLLGSESLVPGFMSWTSMVPLVVPSVTHSSLPWVGSLAVKKVRLPTGVKLVENGDSEFPFGLMSFKRCVPAAVPSETQGSWKEGLPPLPTK
jgi:hypothetical protein